jgi:beta-glucanase (GH16 family)
VWEDHFDGDTLNSSRWNVLEQVHRGGVYTKNNVRVENGHLVMETRAQNLTIKQGAKEVPFFVTSGAVNTSGLFEQKHGRWEASVKLPMVYQSLGYTLHTSIWLFENEKAAGVSGCNHEIDVVEQYTASAGPVSSAVGNLHPFNGTRAGSGGCRKVPYPRPLSGSTALGDWTTNFTNFRVDWTESWIVMYVNGEVYANYGLAEGDAAAVARFTDPLFLALTACVMERVPPIAQDVLPQQYLVDYVKVYEWL